MDLKLIETGDGGDLVFQNGDIKLTSEVYNQPYLAHFGGNIENSTTDEFSEEDKKQFDLLLERMLHMLRCRETESEDMQQ